MPILGDRRNLRGKRFGKLLVTHLVGRKHRMQVWACICDCGNETTAIQCHLVTGRRVSCGCQKIEGSRIAAYKRAEDLTGKTVESGVKVLRLSSKIQTNVRHPRRLWVCLCHCGKEFEATADSVRRGNRKSCGCIGHGRTPKRFDVFGAKLTMKELAELGNIREAGVYRRLKEGMDPVVAATWPLRRRWLLGSWPT
jgi:hypothetical protein